MAENGVKTYKIQINGIEESITSIDKLINSLKNIEERINAIDSKKLSVGVSSTSNSGTLTEDAALQKEINKLKNEGVTLDAKIAATQDEVYKKVQATKDLYKEAVSDQKTIAAQERLTADAYSNTMQGMKDKLADLKAVINSTDLGDNDGISKLTKEADELNSKLLEMEKAYGQFHRQVGNYQDAANAFKGLEIQVGNTTKKFENAKQAYRELANELRTLQVKKDQGILLSAEEAQRFKELPEVVAKIKSSIDDAGKPMDALMDHMRSFTAMASVGKGISAFFGFDNNEISKSIQQLVALQGVLQGLQTIQKQMQTGEGFGKYFSKAFGYVDTATHRLQVFNRALLGTGTTAKAVSASIKVLGVAIKSLMSIGVTAAIMYALDALQDLIKHVNDWVKGNADLVDSEKLLKYQLDLINTALQERLNLNNTLYNAGYLTKVEKEVKDEEALAKALAEANDEIARRAGLDKKNATFNNAYTNGVEYQKEFFQGYENTKDASTLIQTYDDLTSRWKELSKAISEGNKKLQEGGEDTNLLRKQMDGLKNELNNIEQFIAGNMVKAFSEFDISTQEGRRQLADFVQGIINGSDEMQKSVLLRMPEIVSNNEGKFGDALNKYVELVRKFASQANSAMQQFKFDEYVNSILDAADETGRRQYERQKKELEQRWASLNQAQREERFKEFAEAQAALDKQFQKRQKKVSNQNLKDRRRAEKEEKDKQTLIVSVMKDGLAKQLAQLEEERREKLERAKEYGIDLVQVNAYYDEKIIDAKKKFYDDMRIMRESLYQDLLDGEIEYLQKSLENNDRYEKMFERSQDDGAMKRLQKSSTPSSYGIQGVNSYKRKTREKLQPTVSIDNEFINGVKELIDLEREYEAEVAKLHEMEATEADFVVQTQRAKTDALKGNLKEWEDALEKSTEKDIILATKEKLIAEGYTKDLSVAFNQRMGVVEDFWKERIQVEEQLAEKNAESQKALINKQTENALIAEQTRLEKSEDAQYEYYKQQKQLIIDTVNDEAEKEARLTELNEEFNKINEKLYEDHKKIEEEIESEGNAKIIEADTATLEKQRTLRQEYYNSTLQEIAKFNNALAQLEQRQPVKNDWDIVNLKKTNANNRQLLAGYEELINKINLKKQKLNQDWNNGLIDKEVYETSLQDLDAFSASLGDKIDDVKKKLNIGNQIAEVLKGAQQYIQAGMDSFNQIMSAVWDAQDTQFEKEQEALDKEKEMIKNALSEQDKIIEEHKNKVDSIEDELANSRGARRQHLIDQLNAEMEAERRAQKEKERLKKQEELNKKKQDKLELERKKAEYQRNMIQAAVNGAMAITYAMMNTWPIPAIPMMALAASTTATQLAIMAANKPYAKGGILDGGGGVAVGPRHRDGGIPVLGGRASIEGGEFITNRVTTQYNAPLLEYINSKKKRVDVTDLIDFYTGNKVRSNISAIKTKYADGGALPALPNNLDIRDQISNVIVNQDNRPIYVTVTDIQNKMDDVKYVKTLAGLEG